MMGQLEYLEALKRALAGLPPELIAATLAHHEQCFVDGMAAGRSETAIAADLGEPRAVALKLRADAHMAAFARQANTAMAPPMPPARSGQSWLRPALWNLLMLLPALVYTALLAGLYAMALSVYLAGIAITASGLSGANELLLDRPLYYMIAHDGDDDDGPTRTRVSISDQGIHIQQEAAPGADPQPDISVSSSPPRLIERAETVAGGLLRVSTDTDTRARVLQSLLGLGLVCAGIALFLIALALTRHLLSAIMRRARATFSSFKGS